MNIEHELPTEMNAPKKNPTATAGGARPQKGRYLKEPPAKARNRRRRRKLNPRFVLMLAVLLLMLIGIAIGIRSCARPTIKGRWDLDGTTVYEFGKDGKGALVLMTMEYEFSYKLEGNELYIDFEDEMALDAKYSVVIKKQILFMTGGPGDAMTEYVLHKLS